MAAVPRSPLPTELLHIITSLVTHQDLPAVALANKLCNEICTPLLYRTIHLYDYSTARQCVRTLASDPSALSFRRDLACLVREFFLHSSCHSAEPFARDPVFDALLVRSAASMSNVQVLECTEPRECSLLVLLALLANGHRALRSIETSLLWSSTSPTEDPHERAFHQLASRRSAMPRLTLLKVHVPIELSPSMATVLHNMITSSSDTMRTLSITTHHNAVLQAIIPPLSMWHALRKLEVYADALRISGFGYLSQVKSLSIIDSISLPRDGFLVPPTHWPVLEELGCSLGLVPSFLPPQAEAPRPIHTIRLSYATYEHNGGWYDPDFTPSWRESLYALTYAQHSAVPLKHFNFQVEKLNIRRFELFLPYLRDVETIVIVIVDCPTPDLVHELGAKIIARLPRLHTLLLCDISYKEYGSNKAFKFARDVALQRAWLAEYARHSSVLRHVAFTTEFEWVKGADGAWYPTELPKDKPIDVDPEVDYEDSMASWEDEVESELEALEELDGDGDD
ncbi:hypothetical protein BV20DRAFT_1028597 [Pilatotrama ljubarskyi]|nr:hypothetical protein BV20DRAFT_1028597 [Pilatotrama ljubarskyi]